MLQKLVNIGLGLEECNQVSLAGGGRRYLGSIASGQRSYPRTQKFHGVAGLGGLVEILHKGLVQRILGTDRLGIGGLMVMCPAK